MELRSLSAAHAPLIAALDAEARGPSAWSTDAWLPYLCPPWAFGAFEGEALLAFAVFQNLVDEAELLFITVQERARRQNIASLLLVHALEQLHAHGCKNVHLEVSAQNVAAQKLYAARGFTTCGRRANYYRDGSDAVLMQCTLPAPADHVIR